MHSIYMHGPERVSLCWLCVGCVLAVCWLCVGSVLAVCWLCACCAFRYNAMIAPLQKLNLSAVLWHQVRCVCS